MTLSHFGMSAKDSYSVGLNKSDCFVWNVVESREESLMMWSFAAIFDFLRRLSGLFKASGSSANMSM